MIGFNGTYLTAATHHGMCITTACLGVQWVIAPWHIAPATQQAILAAFGAEEGKAVITKTNDYLNAIAATDPARAQQLADFIQEDPLLVCSLVETSKTRWLVGDGKAWIDTGVPTDNSTNLDIQFMLTNMDNNQCGICSNGTFEIYFWGNNMEFHCSSNLILINDVKIDEAYRLEVEDGVYNFYRNGELATSGSRALGVQSRSVSLFALNRGTASYMSQAKINHVAIGGKDFLPFTRNNESGMLDIISGTFHPNANTQGSFTIAITDKA